MNRRRVLAIVGAALLALFGTVVLLVYVSTADRRAQQGTALVEVLVATQQIEGGVAPDDMQELVTQQSIPQDLQQDDAIQALEDPSLEGMVTTETILEGEQIVMRQFGDSARGRGGAQDIPEGKEIVTVAIEAQRAAGGRIESGDLVGVMLTFDGEGGSGEAGADDATTNEATTAMVRTGIRVTDVTGGVDSESGAVGENVLVSLEVDQTDAETIVFGQEFGSLWLTRQPEEPLDADNDVRTRDNVLDTGPSG